MLADIGLAVTSLHPTAQVGPLRRAGEVALVITSAAVDLMLWGGDRHLRSGEVLVWPVVPLLTVAIYAALLLRWRRPVAVFGVLWSFALAGLVLPAFDPCAGLLVALHAVARRAARRRAVAALCLCLLPIGVNSYDEAVAAGGDVAALLAGTAVLWAALSFTVWGLGHLAYAAQRRAEQAQRLQAREVVRYERLRLARELHDVIAHAVSAMLLQAAGARTFTTGQDERVDRALSVIEGVGVQTMEELHRLLGLLRADDDPGAGSPARPPSLRDVPGLVALAREGGLDVRFVVEGDPGPVDETVDLAGYRVVQEALTNAVKHAGGGASVDVRLSWGGDLVLSVRDSGGAARPGRPQPSSGFGLVGLAERVALAGGRLETGPVGGGFLVRAELPLRPGVPVPRRASSAADAP